MITVTPRPAAASDLRTEYLDLLPEPQELFVENLVAKGSVWSIRQDDHGIGYAVIHGDETLVELHVSRHAVRHLTGAFDVLVENAGVRRILAKSFDAALLFAAFSRPCRFQTAGMLYRIIADSAFTENARVKVRSATRDDVANLLRLGADFFDGRAEIEDYISTDGLLIYQTREGVALGAGVMKRVVAGRDDFDIGMVVHPEHRRQGQGAYIIAHLKSHCLEQGLRPICGCSVDNLASQRTLERGGFASRHRLVEFQW
jgi:GNAT superfamily N-acetyltransferase